MIDELIAFFRARRGKVRGWRFREKTQRELIEQGCHPGDCDPWCPGPVRPGGCG